MKTVRLSPSRSVASAFGLGFLSLALISPSLGAQQQGSRRWIWISPEEVRQLPSSGRAWDLMVSDANQNLMNVDLGDQNNKHDSYMMAAGLVYLKLKETNHPSAESYRSRVQRACIAAIGTENNAADALAPCRQVCAVVIAANLIDWDDSAEKARFRDWVDDIRFKVFPDGRSITSTHEDRPNNWGTHAGASRLACAIYLKDWRTAFRCAQVLAGWLGNREAYHGFDYADLSWQADERAPVGVNPKGAVKEGYDIDGVLPDDQRRAGSFPDTWTEKTNYVYEALQGIVTMAAMLDHQNLEAWGWSDSAIRRAFAWLDRVHHQPLTDGINGSDDVWQGYLINHIYGTGFPEPASTSPGKAVGYTDWTTLNPSWP